MQGLNYKSVVDEIQSELAELRGARLRRAAYLALARAIVQGDAGSQAREFPAPPPSTRAA